MIFVNFHRRTSRKQTHMTRHKSSRKTLRSTKKNSFGVLCESNFPSVDDTLVPNPLSATPRHALTAPNVIVTHLCLYCLSILFRSIFSRRSSSEKVEIQSSGLIASIRSRFGFGKSCIGYRSNILKKGLRSCMSSRVPIVLTWKPFP